MQTPTNSTKTPTQSFNWLEPHWYAVYTRANHEKRVAEQLDSRNVQQLLPLYCSVRQWKDRKVRIESPLFPGYVFVNIALQERLRVLELPGVVSFVSFGNQPTRLSDEDISAVRHCMNPAYRVEPHPYLCVGQRVRVKNGPLRNQEGVIVRTKNRARFVLSLGLIARAVVLEASEMDLEPICLGNELRFDGSLGNANSQLSASVV